MKKPDPKPASICPMGNVTTPMLYNSEFHLPVLKKQGCPLATK